jgi:excisionase family DNA binding protein
MTTATTIRYLTVAELAERYGTNETKILSWIKAGELRAIDISARRGERPRWRISPEALETFERARESQPPAPTPIRRRKPERPPGWVEYF